ncbi:MarR family transcriptional regulator, partial [Halanaerobium sp.]
MEKGSFKNMKKQNQKNILTLIKNEDGISRAQIAEKLDVSRATVTNIVRELVKLELVEESKMGESRGGRRPMLLKL